MSLISIFLALLIIRSLINNIFTFTILRKSFKVHSQEVELYQDRELYIILPVMCETNLIHESIEYIYECINGLRNIKVYIVGNSRERNIDNVNETLEIAKKAIQDKPTFVILELQTNSGVMAHQINFAVDEISRNSKIIEKVWIFIINIDSRFSREAILSLISEINKDTKIIQQSAFFLSNFEEIGPIQRGVAISQSRWTISHEVKRLMLHKVFSYYLCHVVGHGLCINLMKYQEYGMLPEDTVTEDLHFGYYLAASGETITSLDVFELADSPVNVRDILKQKYVWSFGPMLYPKYMLSFIRKFPQKWKQNRLRALVIMVQGFLSYLNWLTSSWLILVFLLEMKRSVLAIAFLLIYFLEYFQCIIYFYLRGYTKSRDVFTMPFMTLIAVLFHSIPADKALFDLLLGKKVTKYKTHHQ